MQDISAWQPIESPYLGVGDEGQVK